MKPICVISVVVNGRDIMPWLIYAGMSKKEATAAFERDVKDAQQDGYRITKQLDFFEAQAQRETWLRNPKGNEVRVLMYRY